MTHLADPHSFAHEQHTPMLTHTIGVPPSHRRGKRNLLRDRFVTGGADAVPDYELLELVLFRAMPQHDVKPLAFALIDYFGDFNSVISAPLSRLRNFSGVNREVALEIKLIEAASHRLARSKIMHRPVLSNWKALLTYCHTVMAHRETEQFRVLYLDIKNALIADQLQAEGTIDHVPVYPREVMKHALDLNAAAIILVHNHPSGDPTPSDADIDMTHQISNAANALSITLHDHLIIGKSTEFSFKAQGFL